LDKSLVKREFGYILFIEMGTFLQKEWIYPPQLRRRDRHIILIFTWEERMEDWVSIWHLILFEDVVGHPR